MSIHIAGWQGEAVWEPSNCFFSPIIKYLLGRKWGRIGHLPSLGQDVSVEVMVSPQPPTLPAQGLWLPGAEGGPLHTLTHTHGKGCGVFRRLSARGGWHFTAHWPRSHHQHLHFFPMGFVWPAHFAPPPTALVSKNHLRIDIPWEQLSKRGRS